MALGVEAELGIDDLVESMAGADQIFHAVASPFNRTAEQARCRADENLLRIERALAAEAAAHVGGDHADVVAGYIERGGERIAHDARYLRRRMQRKRAPAGIVFGETGAWLNPHRGLAVHAEASLDPHRPGRGRGSDGPTLQRAADM